MKAWTFDIDRSTIPDEVIVTERARRNAARRSTFRGGRNVGRPKKVYTCAQCTARIEGSREAASHRCKER